MVFSPTSRLRAGMLPILALLLLVSCTHIEDLPWDRDVADKDAILELYRRRLAVSKAGDLAGWVSLFSRDAIILPANSRLIRGRTSIREWQEQFTKGFKAETTLTIDELIVSGDWAICRSRISGQFVPRNGGEPRPVNGREVAVLKRQRTGSWKIARLIGNSSRGPRLETSLSGSRDQ